MVAVGLRLVVKMLDPERDPYLHGNGTRVVLGIGMRLASVGVRDPVRAALVGVLRGVKEVRGALLVQQGELWEGKGGYLERRRKE